MRLLWDAVEEYIDIPLRKYDTCRRCDKVEDTSKVETKSVVDRGDVENYLNPLRGVPCRWLVKGSGMPRK